jgi:hypothetical protein
MNIWPLPLPNLGLALNFAAAVRATTTPEMENHIRLTSYIFTILSLLPCRHGRVVRSAQSRVRTDLMATISRLQSASPFVITNQPNRKILHIQPRTPHPSLER